MKKKNGITKINSPLALENIEAFKQLVKNSMPEFIAEIETKEDFANAIYSTSQEMMLVIDDVLMRSFKFKEEDIKKLHTELQDVLRGVKEFEDRGLSILSPHSVSVVGDIIEEKGILGLLADLGKTRFLKERAQRSGIELPHLSGSGIFIKKLKERNNTKT